MALRASEEKYRSLVENALVGIYKTNLQGDFLYVNEALLKIYEFGSLEEMMSTGDIARYKNRHHPMFVYEMLSEITFLRPALDIPYCRHEKWDGTGYPRGIKGKQIPLSARIFAVVDVWDALCSDLPYRPAWPKEKVRKYIKQQSGVHFDPKVVEVFLKMEMEW